VLRNTLFLNRGDGTYAEIAQAAGVHASEWSWSASVLDVDFDGFEDLLIANGHAHDVNNSDAVRAAEGADNAGGPGQISGSLLAFPPLPARNAAFRNRGDLSFADATRFRGGSSPWTEVHGYRRVVAPRPQDSERRPTRQDASPVDYHLSGFLNKPVNGPGKPGKECAEFRGNLPTRHRPAAICATTATSNCASGTRGTSSRRSRSLQPRLNFALWACA
jgi:hypothetical protein